MLSPTRLNDVRILHFEPATLGGQRCACNYLAASMHYCMTASITTEGNRTDIHIEFQFAPTY